MLRFVRSWSAISRSLPQFAPARRPQSRRQLRLERLEDRALLSTFTVNSLGDTGTGSGLSGDLRYVITRVDKTPGDNTINFAVTGTITLHSALPDLSNTTGLTDVEGPRAASLTVARSSASGTLDFRIFTVDAGVTVSLSGMTITGGNASDGGGIDNSGMLTVNNSVFSSNTVGGGICNGGVLMVIGSTFTSNSAVGVGGGICNIGMATVINSTFTGNSTNFSGYFPAGGGGIYNVGTATVRGSSFAGNSAVFFGGGIYCDGGTVAVTGSTFINNAAVFGGGILNSSGTTLTVTNSTFAHNHAGEGGGIFGENMVTVTDSVFFDNDATAGNGGGIDTFGMLTVTGSTFTDNSTSNDGGGIADESSEAAPPTN